jgi:AAA ATPase domain
VNENTKGKSPFYPGQPVPVELFVGREPELERITRALSQVRSGKPQYVFVTGDYGIGKSSLASFVKFIAEKEYQIFGIHVFLGGATDLEEVATRTVEAMLKTGAYESNWTESVRNVLAKYVGKQDLFGFSINLQALQSDGPVLSHGYLGLLEGLFKRLRDQGAKGLVLILDEINGITANTRFAHFIKGLVDENAVSKMPLPILLMLCGVEERRRDLIRHHQPIERIFDIAEIRAMSDDETGRFFEQTFASQSTKVDRNALDVMKYYSAGYPKVMHILGDAAFWIDKDEKIDHDDALSAVVAAAEDVGRKFVDQQVLKALRSKDYRSILAKLSGLEFGMSFKRAEIAGDLSTTEKGKFDNFLQKMKKLNVLRAGDEMGEYVFNSRLVRLYVRFNSAQIAENEK